MAYEYRIPFSLLSRSAKSFDLKLPVHPLAPSRGVALLRVRRISQATFRELKNDLIVAEKQALHAVKESLAPPFTNEKERAVDKAKDTLRAAQCALVCAMVEGHDPKSFPAFTVPPEIQGAASGTDLYEGALTILASNGYNEIESLTALQDGVVYKGFVKTPSRDTSPEMFDFYRVCQPDSAFLNCLIVALIRFMDGDVRTPAQISYEAGVPSDQIPKDF